VTHSSVTAWVAARFTGGATPASRASAQRSAQRHQRSPGRRPANPWSGRAVERSFPARWRRPGTRWSSRRRPCAGRGPPRRCCSSRRDRSRERLRAALLELATFDVACHSPFHHALAPPRVAGAPWLPFVDEPLRRCRATAAVRRRTEHPGAAVARPVGSTWLTPPCGVASSPSWASPWWCSGHSGSPSSPSNSGHRASPGASSGRAAKRVRCVAPARGAALVDPRPLGRAPRTAPRLRARRPAGRSARSRSPRSASTR